MSSAICFNLDQSKILSSGIGLREIVGNEYILFTTQEDHDGPISLT